LSIQDNVNYVKKELSGDEKVLESAVKIATLYRKHKLKLWVFLIALVIFFIGRGIEARIEASKLLTANEAFLSLQSNAKDTKALEILKENNLALFELYSYTQAIENKDSKALHLLSKSKNAIIADMSAYGASVIEEKAYNSLLYKDMALFTQAYLSIESANIQDAKNKLQEIDEESALATVTGFLKHSTIKDK
jgi:hypothetical protein